MRFAIALSIFALVLLYGCASRAVPYACQPVAQDRLANCVYVNAVLEQNPYYCYSLESMVQRKTCLQDAAEPAMKAALQRSSPGEKDSIFAPQAPSEPVYPQGAPSAPASPEKQGCEAKSGAERDACLKSEAISALDISKCGRISGASLRKECISDVARKTKDIGSCAVFNTTDDVNLCKLYAKGEEAKS